jgi:hypothetical protein
MGWTARRFEAPFTARAVIAFCLGDDVSSRIVDAACSGSVVYAAIRSLNSQEVFGLVLLTERRDGLLYTKPIPDNMGPAEDACPAKILKLLTPTTSRNARGWRDRCHARLVGSGGRCG